MKHLLSFLLVIITISSYSQNNANSLFVPYSLVNEVPFFNSCGNLLTNKEKETCMKERIIKEITSNINVTPRSSMPPYSGFMRAPSIILQL